MLPFQLKPFLKTPFHTQQLNHWHILVNNATNKKVDHLFHDDEKLASLVEIQANRVSGAQTSCETSFPASTNNNH